MRLENFFNIKISPGTQNWMYQDALKQAFMNFGVKHRLTNLSNTLYIIYYISNDTRDDKYSWKNYPNYLKIMFESWTWKVFPFFLSCKLLKDILLRRLLLIIMAKLLGFSCCSIVGLGLLAGPGRENILRNLGKYICQFIKTHLAIWKIYIS